MLFIFYKNSKMGVFNFIETIFFISLGITFVLILLLVYHFKQRISIIEQKSDTMLEIINNIVKEIYILKNTQHIASRMFNTDVTEPFINQATLTVPVTFTPPSFEKINVSEIDTDSDSEDGDDSESDGSESDEDSMPGLEPVSFEIDDAVKVINVSLSEISSVDLKEIEEPLGEDETELGGEQASEELPEINSETIHVEKIETVEDPENLEETSDDSQSQKESAKEVYRKMTLQSLKALVITKGLCSDPSKLKKNDLLKMLEVVDE
jgi:hypothetical protein